MRPGSMAHSEMIEFCEHMRQLAMHAGHALGDAKRAAPEEYHKAIDLMMTETRAFFRASKYFQAAVTELKPKEETP